MERAKLPSLPAWKHEWFVISVSFSKNGRLKRCQAAECLWAQSPRAHPIGKEPWTTFRKKAGTELMGRFGETEVKIGFFGEKIGLNNAPVVTPDRVCLW
jgi:hypothetical protein